MIVVEIPLDMDQRLNDVLRRDYTDNWDQYKPDVLEAVGLAGHPKAEVVWELARELELGYAVNFLDMMAQLALLVK